MDGILVFLLIINLVSGLLLLPYPINMFILALSSFKWKDSTFTDYYKDSEFPTVTIQLPVYNEEKVIRSTLNEFTKLKYPKNKLVIQVLDDSSDNTSAIIDFEVDSLKKKGLNVQIVRRTNRIGYKAGALTNGLKNDNSKFIAIFDADFKVNPSFLENTIHFFKNNEQLGAIQTRWAHSNLYFSLFTRSMSIGIDAHFLIEKPGQIKRNAFISFNGTGGIWRREAIEKSGGWSSQTLAEDLDLAYRAQIHGYKILYLRDIINFQEVPPTIRSWIIQQSRWAKGFSQNLRKNLLLFWKSSRGNSRIQGLIHLTQYFLPLLILINTFTGSFLLYIPQYHGDSFFALGILFTIAALLGIIAYLITIIRAKRKKIDIFLIPCFLFWGAGLIVRMGIGTFMGLIRKGGAFTKTPKFNLSNIHQNSKVQTREKIPLDKIFFIELMYMVVIGLGLLKAIVLGGIYLSQAFFYVFLLLSLLNLVFSELLHAFYQ